MQVHLSLQRRQMPVRLIFDQEGALTMGEYVEFCRENPDLRVERSALGEIRIMPPAGSESSYRNAKVTAQLDRWAERDKRGKAFDSSSQFVLVDGSALSPDAAWVSNDAIRRFPRERRKEFLPLCPEFVIEVLSPSDRKRAAKIKMEQWIANGAQLAWLIDGDGEAVHIYRPGKPVETRRRILRLSGEGPVKGFVLRLKKIWEGLR